MLQIFQSVTAIAAIGLFLLPFATVGARERRRAFAIMRSKRFLGPTVLICTVLAGCASAGEVMSTNKQGTMTVSASAMGGRLAWARAHRRAMTEATDYCDHRGMQASFADEQTAGVDPLQQHESVVRFECHPRF